MIVRSLRPIEPSADFMTKLSNRIAELQANGVAEPPQDYRLTTGAFAALAAGLTLFAYVTIEAKNRLATPETLMLPPVVATAPATPAPAVNRTAYMAAISTGMGVWPAVLMADDAPRRMADVELQQASLR